MFLFQLYYTLSKILLVMIILFKFIYGMLLCVCVFFYLILYCQNIFRFINEVLMNLITSFIRSILKTPNPCLLFTDYFIGLVDAALLASKKSNFNFQETHNHMSHLWDVCMLLKLETLELFSTSIVQYHLLRWWDAI